MDITFNGGRVKILEQSRECGDFICPKDIGPLILGTLARSSLSGAAFMACFVECQHQNFIDPNLLSYSFQ